MGQDLTLPMYSQLKEGDFDPIEIYAYYIGLYINQIFSGRIYLKYLLSFPVTYDLNIRQRILNSFRKGLAKSLPPAVRNDEAVFSKFSVKQGAGEPAAYAVCALQEYGFKPREGENVYFGIFDFGGGTTDFDFGVWRKASAKERRYTYVITHFGDGGDRRLGGENLLELMAFESFRNNLEIMRKFDAPFTLPEEEEEFPGSERILSDSQQARTNTRQLMEALRPLWERTRGYEKNYERGVIRLRLFTSRGEETTAELRIDMEEMEELLRKRIRKGVDSFIDALRSVFRNKLLENQQVERFHIFLAGNSSKSAILREEFDAGLRQLTDSIRQEYQKRGEDQAAEQEYFELYPPLGTEEACEKMKARNCWRDGDQLGRPTGKTGVAIGLVQCREGGTIKVVSEKASNEEIKFKFWIGEEDREYEGHFQALITRDTPYGQWHEYYDAGVADFEFYYTTSPTAGRRVMLPMTETKVCGRQLPDNAVNEDWSIFLRAVSPSELEYVVAASKEDADAGNYKFGPERVKLD